jgi:hypothetical protein
MGGAFFEPPASVRQGINSSNRRMWTRLFGVWKERRDGFSPYPD